MSDLRRTWVLRRQRRATPVPVCGDGSGASHPAPQGLHLSSGGRGDVQAFGLRASGFPIPTQHIGSRQWSNGLPVCAAAGVVASRALSMRPRWALVGNVFGAARCTDG